MERKVGWWKLLTLSPSSLKNKHIDGAHIGKGGHTEISHFQKTFF